MIESIHFKNYKALRDATLPLERFTLLIGPNGSGKSTALQALKIVAEPTKILVRLSRVHAAALGRGGEQTQSRDLTYDDVASKVGQGDSAHPSVEIALHWSDAFRGITTTRRFKHPQASSFLGRLPAALKPELAHERLNNNVSDQEKKDLERQLSRMRVYSLQSEMMKLPVPVEQGFELEETGANLAAVLDALDDSDRDRFNQLQEDFVKWLPEFDQIAFDRSSSQKSLALRLRGLSQRIPASDLSDGTLLSLALLTLTHLPTPPVLVGLEEPDRGLHPRLLRDVKDALYRLAYPENYGEARPPVQVIVTTHSPYMLDLFKDHPEQVVLANKDGNDATFTRLTDIRNWQEILGDAALGEAWYTGVFGGVPVGT